MPRDRLQLLQTVRRRTVEEARRVLAQHIAEEARAGEAIAALDRAAERDAGAVIAEGFWYQDMVSARLGALRQERQAAVASLQAAADRTAQVRGVAVAARTAAEAADTLIAERAVVRRTEDLRREQHLLDKMVRRR